MKTSVVIPSYKPELKLKKTLEKLVPQAALIDELIIVIDNSNYTEFAKLLVEEYSTKLNIKIFPQSNSGRAISRNRGVEASTGDIIIFLDDDMLTEKDLIEKHIQYHVKTPGIIVSGNGYRNPDDAKHDFDKFLVKVETGWKKQSGGSGEITFKKFNFTACNMSLPRQVFEQLGGFDTRFSDGEDFDFAVRAINNSIRIIYDNTLLAWHNDWPGIDTYIKRQNEYELAKIQIVKVHPDYLGYFPNLIVTKGSKMKKLISKIIRLKLGKWVISKNSIFETLPLNLKFFLYKITISSYSNINR